MLNQDRRERDDTSLTSDGNYCYYRVFSFHSENGLQSPQYLTETTTQHPEKVEILSDTRLEVQEEPGLYQTTQHQLQSDTHEKPDIEHQ